MKINSALQSFPGITLNQIVYFEKCFEINVNVCSLQEDGTAQVIYKSKCKFSDTIYLNLFDHHLSYITKFDTFNAELFIVILGFLNNLKNKHQRVCTKRTKKQFQGGFYSTPDTVFDKLEQHGISVNAYERF